jgi:toxin ParE1/3/4
LPRVLKTLRAERDLDDIWLHIASDNPQAADQLIDALVAQARLVATQPNMGRARPELAPEIRSFVEKNYILFYRPVSNGIELVRVLHGARDLNMIFQSDDD